MENGGNGTRDEDSWLALIVSPMDGVRLRRKATGHVMVR